MLDSRLNSFIVEMVGSAAICGLTYAAERLIGARRGAYRIRTSSK